ncbi:MAG: C40 family peptidase [Gemmatimonadetes bacterium]|nr:C40 family peptidase [Gemmatimonadota bacterium]
MPAEGSRTVKLLEELIGQMRAARASDARTAIFEVRVEAKRGGVALVGQTTDRGALDELATRAAELPRPPRFVDRVIRLPDPALGPARYGLVRAALAPVLAEPRASASQLSQYVLGHRLDLLARSESWLRVRGEDGYIGWVHQGYVEVGEAEWAQAWERSEGGEPVVSLGAELVDEAERAFARLPWGARVIRDTPNRYRLPDGRRGSLGDGELVEADRLRDRFPPMGESLTRTARRWIATPYLWGGVTPAGADCSGFVQSIFWMHGLALPRDSDQQARVGVRIDAGQDFGASRAGDLLFFAEGPERITHVAISLGGPHIVHSALSNGGVEVNDLTGELELEHRLRDGFVEARRVLPD